MIQTKQNEHTQDIWLKAKQHLQRRGNWTQDIGIIDVLYVPDKFIITDLKLDLPINTDIDDLLELTLSKINEIVEPKYVEISIKSPIGIGAFLTYGKNDGWKQVATFRFSEPRL